MQCQIYKGRKAPDTYLYVPAGANLTELPEELLGRLGPLKKVMDLELDSARKLARADATVVIAALKSQGFYLQVPPPKEILMGNHMLPR